MLFGTSFYAELLYKLICIMILPAFIVGIGIGMSLGWFFWG
jgi:hypothetical protein